ncbi:MAG: hypothetical protein AAF985_20320 [Bacteroidota bacterium]
MKPKSRKLLPIGQVSSLAAQLEQQGSDLRLLNLPHLSWQSPKLDHTDQLNERLLPLKFRQSRFFLTAGAGWASFNGHPGFHFELGTYFEANQIIGFEFQTAYHFGKDQQIYSIEPTLVDKERQLDANCLVHLNLFKNHRHRIALNPGIGYTFYNGSRRIEEANDTARLEDRASNGINYNGSLEYNYRLNHKLILGIRYGITNYDDAVNYLHFKIYKSL